MKSTSVLAAIGVRCCVASFQNDAFSFLLISNAANGLGYEHCIKRKRRRE